MNVDQELDVRGLSCPLPVLRTKKALKEIKIGAVLKVTATDPGALKDIEALAKQTGNPLLGTETSGNEFVFFLKKGGSSGADSHGR